MTMARRAQYVRDAVDARGASRNRHHPVAKCVSNAIKNVVQLIKTERIETEKARREAAAAHRNAEADRWTAERYAKQRSRDDRAIEELLQQGRCAVRLKMRPPAPCSGVQEWLAESKWNHLGFLRLTRSETSTYESGTSVPLAKITLTTKIAKRRKRSRAVNVWRTMRKPFAVLLRSTHTPPPAPVHVLVDEAQSASYESLDAKWFPPPLPANAVHRDLHYLTVATDHVAKFAEIEWAAETRVDRSNRQKVHGYKSLLGMSDPVFYKHLRDNVIQPKEAGTEVYRRKCCIHAGKSGTYGPPEGVHPTFGLTNEELVGENDAPQAPPVSPTRDMGSYTNWVRDPWQTFLEHKAESALCEIMATKWTVA